MQGRGAFELDSQPRIYAQPSHHWNKKVANSSIIEGSIQGGRQGKSQDDGVSKFRSAFVHRQWWVCTHCSSCLVCFPLLSHCTDGNDTGIQLHIRSNWAIMKVGSRKRCKGPRSLRKDAWHHYREGNAKQNFSVALRVVVRAWGSGGIVGSYFMGRVSVLQDGKSSGDVLYNHRTVTVLNCTCKNGLRQQILCILYHN